MLILDELQRAILQILILSAIPFLWWLIRRTKAKPSFFKWIGLKTPSIANRRSFAVSVVIALILSALMSPVLDPLLPDDVQLANARFSGQGTEALVPAIIFAFFATALPEEILFRGFLGKRLSSKLGFAVGNTLQAVLFGLLHGATLFPVLGREIPLLIISFTGALGWIMGYVTEKADGSVIPSWCLDGVATYMQL